MFNSLFQDIAIDLGTANIRVAVKGSAQLVREPSVVAFNIHTRQILAVGKEARQMIGRTPGSIVATQPLKDGVISDFDATEAMIRYFINRVKDKNSFFKSLAITRVIVGVPSLITEVEINAVVDAAKSAGARKVYIVEEPVASAIGANLKIEDPEGSMIVDIGGGTTDIAVLSLGGVVVDNTVNLAGDEMDKAISDYIKNKYNLKIGVKMAEDIKIKIGDILPSKIETIDIKGQDILSGLPKAVELSSVEISEALMPVIEEITLAIKDAIEKSPPEIVSDLLTQGLTLSGGGSQIKNLDKFLSKKLKMPVHLDHDPNFSVLRGLQVLMQNPQLLEKVQVKDLILK